MRCTTATDSPGSPLNELEPLPKDFGLITEQLESSPEIPETPVVALEKTRHEDDYNTPSHFERTLYRCIPYGRVPYRRVPYEGAPYGCASYRRVPHGRAPYGCVPYRRVPYGRAPYRRPCIFNSRNYQ
jgi:hypothetical protein